MAISVKNMGGKPKLEGTASTDNVLKGKTFYNTDSSVKQTGTMTDNGAYSRTVNPNDTVYIPQGYHNGSGKVVGQGRTYNEYNEMVSQKDKEIENAKNTCNASNLRALGFKNVPSGNWKFVNDEWSISKRDDRIPLTIEKYGRCGAGAWAGIKSNDYKINGKLAMHVRAYMDCTENGKSGFGDCTTPALFLPYFYNGDLTAIQNNVTSGTCYCYLQRV